MKPIENLKSWTEILRWRVWCPVYRDSLEIHLSPITKWCLAKKIFATMVLQVESIPVYTVEIQFLSIHTSLTKFDLT